MDNGASDYYVLKPNGSSRMYPGATMREFIAALVANELGLSTPEPVIIEIDEKFVQLANDEMSYQVLNKSIGLNYGCLYLSGLSTWTNASFLYKNLFSTIQKVFIFDVFIENTDRSQGKPNMLTDNKDIVILDHEIAFSFIDLLLYKNDTPWLLNDNDKDLFRKHLFYSFLNGKEFVCEDFVTKFSSLDKAFWERLQYLIPSDLVIDRFNSIRDHLLNRISKIEIYKEEIKRLLL